MNRARLIAGAVALSIATLFLRLGLWLMPRDERFLNEAYIASGTYECADPDCLCNATEEVEA